MKQNIEKTFFTFAKNFTQSDIGKALLIAFTWQLIMTCAGLLFDTSLFNIFDRNPSLPLSSEALAHTLNWDGGWYKSIILNGLYMDPTSAASVFYPLFPVLVWTLQTISFGIIEFALAGIILNTLALSLSILALVKIADRFVPEKYRWWLPLLFVTSPAAIFMHFFYTEALFCALAFWSYYFALQRQWWRMGIALAFLTAVRLPALLFIGLCALEFLRAYSWSIRKIFNKNILWFLLAPLGFIAFGTYLFLVRDNFFAMFEGYKLTSDWDYQIFNLNIFETYKDTARELLNTFTTPIPFDEGQVVNRLLPLIGIGILFATSIYSFLYKRSKGIPLALFGVAAMIMFSLNSNLISVHRYLLPCIVIYIAILHLSTRRDWLKPIFYICIYIGTILQTYLYILYVNGYFAG